jgi:hypothetical protein
MMFRGVRKRYRKNTSIFWNKTICITLKINRHFGVKCRLSLRGQRISGARKQVVSRALSQKTELFTTTAVRISNPTMLQEDFYF